MKTVTADVGVLVETLKENKKKHVEEYQAALEGYAATWDEDIERVLGELDQLRDDVQKADVGDIKPYWGASIQLPAPKSFEKDYDRAIGMLKLHTEPSISLDAKEYDRYVLDEWDWKGELAASNTLYASKTSWT